MKTRAAVLISPDRPLELANLRIPALRPGQVLVRMAYAGVCQTQLLEARGHRGDDPFLPHCLGHEGTGTVVETSSASNGFAAGDPVVLSWMKGRGADVPGTQYDWNGRTVNAGGVTTFGELMVVSENRLTPAPEGLSMRDAALLGCAIPTGFGAVLNTANLRPGETLAVFGAGGVGLCAIIAGQLAGADPIVAIDVRADRLAAAEMLGATDIIDSSKVDDLKSSLVDICGPVDVAIEATGVPDVMTLALASVAPRGGRAVVVGNAHHGNSVQIDPWHLNQGKSLLGTWGGDNDPPVDFPRYSRLIRSRNVDMSPISSPDYALEDLNQALRDLETGATVRPIIRIGQP